MITIGLISDTHGVLDTGVSGFLASCDEIWHAGDVGNTDILDALMLIKPTRAVHGNIDGAALRFVCPEVLTFQVEGVKVVMMHIGGYPGRYAAGVRQLLEKEEPALFVCGHSHILKIIYDQKHQVLTLNPGAAGHSGFHHLITALRFKIDQERIFDMEIFEKPRH